VVVQVEDQAVAQVEDQAVDQVEEITLMEEVPITNLLPTQLRKTTSIEM